MRPAGWAALGALAVLLTATPAHAENPVFDDETAADITAALDEATAVQGVCYGVRLDVSDQDTGQFSGQYTVSSSPPPGPTASPTTGSPAPAPVCRGVVFLEAFVSYTSSYSELEDSASWEISSTLPGAPTTADLARLGFRAQDLLDDGKSEQLLLNAALSLPALTAEKVPGVVPLVLVESTASPPAEAAPTDTPGSDRLRQHGTSLALLGVLLAGCLGWAVYAAVRPAQPGAGRYGPAVRRAFGRPDPRFPGSYDQPMAYDPQPHDPQRSRHPTDPETY